MEVQLANAAVPEEKQRGFTYLANVINNKENLDKLEWKPFREGIEIHPIVIAPKRGETKEEYPSTFSCALLRYQPGASAPEHIHNGYEIVIPILGCQDDRTGGSHMGSIIVNTPGSHHTPSSTEGCVVFVAYEKPVRFLHAYEKHKHYDF
eukprot:TRINITY_DN23519_c0_g1_i1.p1 TRINITY_DN23519_c0_g1~~TRINITY_DN23519_c0_g1_i1.p1  ORF type:complete len:150 (-),score=36.62 TRINITY_DN23519_c0_g1_i1:109-558(-)